MQNIGQSTIKNLVICVPPENEQAVLVDQLDKLTAKIDNALSLNMSAIERLQEYRTALITAAVTGQIDVRDWQAPEACKQSAQDKDVA
jgi:type I restriction enzyme S subunit